jgi:hypothetical protein
VGLLEAQLRKTLLGAVEDAVRDVHASWNHRASRDVLRAVAAVLSKDEGALARTKGLGAATVRAGLVIEASAAVPVDSRCTGADRVDAVYEGLALSPLGALGFTEATGRVRDTCVATAKESERLVSRALLAPLARGAGPALSAAELAVSDLRARCDAKAVGIEDASFAALSTVAELPSAPTVEQLGKTLGRLRLAKDALARDASKAGEACGTALDVALAADESAVDRLVSAGLAAAEARAVAGELAAAVGTCTDAASACDARARIVAVVATTVANGAPTRAQLVALTRALVAAIVPAGSDPGAALAAIAALEGAIVAAAEATTIDPDAVIAELERRYELRDGKPSLRTLLGLGPSPWVVELNGGVPKLESSDLRIVGDATLGYDATNMGVVVRGGVRYFDFSSNVLSTDNLDAQGWLESWLVTGDERSAFRFEGRLSGGTEYVDTTTITRPAGLGRTNFGDYDSLLIRGALLVGFRVKPSERVGFRVLGGGGYQYERFDSTSVDQNGLSFQSPDSSSGHGTGRIDARWRILPSIVSARAHVEAQYFTLTREELSFKANTVGATSGGITLTTQVQLFASGRAFVDADVLSFGGFVPALWAGADYTYLAAPQGERSTTVPVLGVGIVRPRL